MADNLVLSKDLHLPLAAVTERIGFLGRTGSGKTYAAQKLAEEMHRVGAQFVVLDPVGVWHGLRIAADGKSPGLPIPVLGGLHGDIPLEATGGALIANLVVDRGVSMILDVSQFESDADKARFAEAFASRFFFRKKSSPSAVHLFIEEAQEFCPQNHQRGEERMLHAFTRLVKIGRNFGIGVSLISQRPQEVNKKVLNLTELLFCFQLTGPQERKTIQGWIAEKGIDEDIAAELPKLDVGQPHVWSPAWLKISERVRIAQKHTLDVSSTPLVGKQAVVRALSPIDLEGLRLEMAETIERAKLEDPKALRQELQKSQLELAELRQDLESYEHLADMQRQREAPWIDRWRQETGKANTLPDYGDMLAWLAAKAEEAEAVAAASGKVDAAVDGFKLEVRTAIDEALEDFKRHVTSVAALPVVGPIPTGRTFMTREVTPRRILRDPPPGNIEVFMNPEDGESRTPYGDGVRGRTYPGAEPKGPAERILRSLAWWQAARVGTPTREQVAFAARYTVNGHFNNVLGDLRTQGLVDYPGGGQISLTPAGAKAASRFQVDRPTRQTLIDNVRGLIRNNTPKLKIFDALVKFNLVMTREALAASSGYTVNGHFNNMLGELRTAGIVEYPGSGQVALSSVFASVGR